AVFSNKNVLDGLNGINIVAADADSAGRQGIAVATGGANEGGTAFGNRVVIAKNRTAGGLALPFGPPLTYFAGSDPLFLAVADFSGSGRLDIAVGNSSLSALTILTNTTPIITRPLAVGTILDDDNFVSLGITGNPFPEKGGVATVTATLAAAANR